MKNYKDLPIEVLKFVNKLKMRKSVLYELADFDNTILTFVDKDKGSNFIFQIISYEVEKGKLSFDINFRPRNTLDNNLFRTVTTKEATENCFHQWIHYLQEYEDNRNPEDPIIKQYQEEFFADFEIVDEDAERNAYDLKTQLLIDKLLESMIYKLDTVKTDNNSRDIAHIKSEVQSLQNEQTNLTKKEFGKRFSKILATIRKSSIGLMKQFWDEVKKEVFKQIIHEAVDKIHQIDIKSIFN